MQGEDEARQVTGVTDVRITAKVGNSSPCPAGSYLGFIFGARRHPKDADAAVEPLTRS